MSDQFRNMETLKEILEKLSKEEIQNAVFELNLFTWPSDLAIFKPVGWDFMTPDKRRNNDLGVRIFQILNSLVDESEMLDYTLRRNGVSNPSVYLAILEIENRELTPEEKLVSKGQ